LDASKLMAYLKEAEEYEGDVVEPSPMKNAMMPKHDDVDKKSAR